MGEVIHTLPDRLTVTWEAEALAIVDTWTSYQVGVDEFRVAVLEKGLGWARKHGGRAWVVDSSSARGAFSQAVQELIGSEIFPAFAANGITHFITIKSTSAVTNLSIASYTSKLGPNGIQLVELPSVALALEWLKAQPK
jgi:hypothetical protein